MIPQLTAALVVSSEQAGRTHPASSSESRFPAFSPPPSPVFLQLPREAREAREAGEIRYQGCSTEDSAPPHWYQFGLIASPGKAALA